MTREFQIPFETDHQLRFNQHMSVFCFKAAMQLNTLSSLQRFMGKVEKTAIINSFIDARWFGIFVLGNLLKKLNTFKNVVLSLNLIAKVVMKL